MNRTPRLPFRKHYIRNVEFSETLAKQELRDILSVKPVDINILSQFTLKKPLPSDYRPIVWKLLTGIMPRFAESQEFVRQQHVLMYEDLLQALKVLRLDFPVTPQNNELNGHSDVRAYVSLQLHRNSCTNSNISDTKNPEPEHFFLMWLISEARLWRYPENQLSAPENQKYILIGHKLHCLIDDPVDTYHICASLWSSLRKNEATISSCVQSAIGLLHKKNASLHSHLNKVGLFSSSLLEDQAFSLFCELLPESSVEIIVDKVLAGGFEILTHLIVTLLCHLQNSLFLSSSVENVRNILYQIRREQADIVLTDTMDSWL